MKVLSRTSTPSISLEELNFERLSNGNNKSEPNFYKDAIISLTHRNRLRAIFTLLVMKAALNG